MRLEGEAARNCSSAEERQTKKRPARPSERNFRTPVIWRARHGRAGWRRDSGRRDMQPDLERTPHSNMAAAASREDLIMGEQKRFRVPKKKPRDHDAPLWQGAHHQGRQGWIDGPRSHTASGKLLWDDDVIKVNPAFRFAALQGAEIRAVGDPESSEANGASVTHAPINLPLWVRVVQICNFFGSQGPAGRFGINKGGDADAYNRRLLR